MHATQFSAGAKWRSPRRGKTGPRHGSEKSVFVRNLRLLATEFPPDLVSSALGISEKTLDALVSEMDSPNVKGYTGHIAARLAAAGENPHAWLEVPIKVNAQLTIALRELAAKADNKSALRRANLKRIYENFSNEPQVLADALDVTQASLLAVLSGDLELNDERTMHIMPRLTRAGFEENWLEDPNPAICVDKLNSLRKLADTIDVDPADEHNDSGRQVSLHGSEVSKMLSPIESKNPSAPPTEREEIPQGTYAGLIGKSVGPLALRVLEHTRDPASATVSIQPQIAAEQGAPAEEAGPSKQEISRHRAEVLDALFNARGSHGVRSRLWLDQLKQRPGLWSALKNGSRFFTDDLARMVEKALGLPMGWLDSNSDEPPELPDWFNQIKPKEKTGKRRGRPTLAEQKAKQKAQQKAKQKALFPPDAQLAAQPVQAPAAPPAAASQPQQSVAAPAPVQAQAIGPVANALLATLRDQSVSGKLTERMSLSLLNLLLAE